MKNKKISVVIPFYNAETTLESCINSLCRQSYHPEEIILVDNNSTDNSKTIINEFTNTFPDLKTIYINCKKQGPSAARNKGAFIATGDWLLFTDSDCVPATNWVSSYLAHFDDDTVGAVAGCIKPRSPKGLVQKLESLFTLAENHDETIHDSFTVTEGLYPSANLAVRKDLFMLIGGFNEGLRYGEDHELCYKVYKSGHKIKAVKDAVVEHIHRESLAGLIKQSFGFGTAHPYELRHFSSGKIIFMSPFLKINRPTPGTYVWIDMNQADKKTLILVLLGLAWWPLFILLVSYLLYLHKFIHKQAIGKNIKTNILELPLLGILLILKSLCLTCGRLSHSLKNRVFCL